MTADIHLQGARAAYERREWLAAAREFAAADAADGLKQHDLGLAGLTAHLSGDDDAAVALMTRSHQAALAAGDAEFAAQMAFWLGMMHADSGDYAVAGGWFSRARRIVDERGVDSVVRGYLLMPHAIGTLDSGDAATALGMFEEAAAHAERFHEIDLATMARLGRGSSLIALGEVERGVEIIDDAMVGVTSGEVGPIAAGMVYCGAIEEFLALFDLRRAQGWTDALTRWCAEQPDLVPFRGRCLVHRAELMQIHGAWTDATNEARRAADWLLRPPPAPAAGEAFYVQAELHRLRGEFEEAEAAYREASRWGRRGEPGLALLRLAQGHVEAARTMILRAVDETPLVLHRAPLLDAHVEILIAAGDVEAAREAADELARLAAVAGTAVLEAIAARADGEVVLASGDARTALAALRRAADIWQALEAPYDLARVRVGIGRACRALGDGESSALELASAREVFEVLGATPDLRIVDAIAGGEPPAPGGLSDREVEVLRLLARGDTNRAIAAELGISERTVDRHVSNIYTKLDLSSRAAATSFAFENHLV